MKIALRLSLLAAFAAASFFGNISFAAAQASGTGGGQATAGKTVAKAPPTGQEIADAKAKGLVWVNLSTHVYHKDSSSMYGATKRGKFMTEDDAKKAGYRAANEAGAAKKKAATTAAAQK